LTTGTPRHLALPLPASSGSVGVVLSESKEIELGARAMLLLAENLFRLDVTLTGDALRTTVRNLSGAELEIEEGLHGETQPHLAYGDVTSYQPGQGRVRFVLDGDRDRVAVDVTIGVLRFSERGRARITAQAVIRQAPAR
jgi:hypothetical protein